MKQVTIILDDYLYDFYRKIGENAGGLTPNKGMEDALFKLAGELSLNAIHKKGKLTGANEDAGIQ